MSRPFIASAMLAILTAVVGACTSETATTPVDPVFVPGDSVDFVFESGGLQLSGVFDVPENGDAKALIIIVHSYGETDIRRWQTYADERRRFNDMGIATAVWDKPGRGRSEGTFDIDQSVYESAQEVLDAVAYLKQINAPGTNKIGLWGGSRAGWIAPVALSRDPDLAFWVSISGTTAEDNFTYLLLSNLIHEGYSLAEVKTIADEWRAGCRLYRNSASFEAYQQATRTLRANEYILRMRGEWPTRLEYTLSQRRCTHGQCPRVDPDRCDYVWIEDFAGLLSKLSIDVLAIFGEKDLNVDWRKTKQLYESTLGDNPDASLVVRTFADSDHAMNVTETGSLSEMQQQTTRTKVEGYLDTQVQWLTDVVLSD
ncbi:MAG: CocE/NonD family hydrolase [Pseudomonadota bacterium]